MTIVTNIDKLKQPCVSNSSNEYNEEVATKLFNIMNPLDDCIGLACNQIGITNARVCVVNVKEPLYFINPEIVDKDEEIYFVESCLSFPGKSVKTKRHKQITIKADNLNEGGQVFCPSNDNDHLGLLEVVAIQHEVAHLNGETMYDYEVEKQKPAKSEQTFQPNEKIQITDGKESKWMKWKKARSLIDSGKWKIYSQSQ